MRAENGDQRTVTWLNQATRQKRQISSLCIFEKLRLICSWHFALEASLGNARGGTDGWAGGEAGLIDREAAVELISAREKLGVEDGGLKMHCFDPTREPI